MESKSLQRNTVFSDRASCFATNVNEWASVGFDSGAFSEISKVQNARQALDRWYQHMSALYMARNAKLKWVQLRLTTTRETRKSQTRKRWPFAKPSSNSSRRREPNGATKAGHAGTVQHKKLRRP